MPSPAPTLIVNRCATPSPCTLPASHPTTNGELHLQLERTEAAWARCAAEVDAIIACHGATNAPLDEGAPEDGLPNRLQKADHNDDTLSEPTP
ncbi:Rz1-like lysis system protein LysC [Kushneria phosphatilytica]|uniref:Rz1-like lysis system protein LysC n=1 Tax=Kushneria phosphatilytica TaxID=657387 RepID=UPI003899119D